jgi:phosphoribosyl-ATP pyrophosphohydrolase/phosphoribosyl-AMP cyclohydrolase
MTIDFDKGTGLVPAIVQDARTRAVLMLGYMNREAYERTRAEGVVTFFSRSRGRLWTKGETSGNRLIVENIVTDCDNDALLVQARPTGPVCHTGADACFDAPSDFIHYLDRVIASRRDDADPDSSYTARLLAGGAAAAAQKVGEEATEVVIEAVGGTDARLLEESADLVFHLLAALAARGLSWADVVAVLEARHRG